MIPQPVSGFDAKRAILKDVQSETSRRRLRDTPTRLGRYELISKLASGGMATVYLGRAIGAAGFSRVVAVKKCHPHLSEDEKFREMFLREARLAAQIHHPNVVATIDVVVDEDLYMVMEYIEGGRVSDLAKVTKAREGNVPTAIALAITLDMLRGLHAAHVATGSDGSALGVIHRDVSPQNLMVGTDGVTRVVDFGVAKALESPATTKSGEIKGKLAYMAPEQLQARRELTPGTDVFAAGVVLWELLAGRGLFAGDSQGDTMQRVLYIPIPKVPSLADVGGDALHAVVMRALERDPTKRYASAREFAEAIEQTGVAVASHDAVAAFVREALRDSVEARRSLLKKATEASVEPVELATRTPSRKSRLLPVALALIALVGAVSLYLAFEHGPLKTEHAAPPVATPSGESPSAPPAFAEPDLGVTGEVAPLPEAAKSEDDSPATAGGSSSEPAEAEAQASEVAPKPRRRPRRKTRGRKQPDEPFRPDKI